MTELRDAPSFASLHRYVALSGISEGELPLSVCISCGIPGEAHGVDALRDIEYVTDYDSVPNRSCVAVPDNSQNAPLPDVVNDAAAESDFAFDLFSRPRMAV